MSQTVLRDGRAEPPRFPYNGRGPPAANAFPSGHLPGGQPGRPGGLDKETTRYLAAATQTHLNYAEDVVARVQHERFRALAPAYGADVVIVTKWALAAIRRRDHRDLILASLLGLSVLLCWAVQNPLPIPFVLLASWLIVSWEHWNRIHNTVTRKMLRDRFTLDGAPDPPSASDRKRLGKVAERRDGNLVVFSGHSAFVGSGKRLYHRLLILDVSRGEETQDGKPQEPVAFTSKDLHDALIGARDEIMYLLLAQTTLLRTVKDFLKAHRVSLAEFDEQVKIIVDQSVKIQGSGNVVGDNSSATVTGESKSSG